MAMSFLGKNNKYDGGIKLNFPGWVIPFVLVAILVILFLIALLINQIIQPNNTKSDEPIPQSGSFIITRTYPSPGEIGVYPGEISIAFDVDTVLTSKNDYSFEIYPSPDRELIDTTTFPTQHVSHGVVGGLRENTKYIISIFDEEEELVGSWDFTTSNETPESSSREALIEQNELIGEYYPLFYEVPFSAGAFSIDYIDRLTLEVKFSSGSITEARQWAEDLIRSKNIDPSSHSINYVFSPIQPE